MNVVFYFSFVKKSIVSKKVGFKNAWEYIYTQQPLPV